MLITFETIQAKSTLSHNLHLLASYTLNNVSVNKSNKPDEKGHIPIVTPRQTTSAWVNYTLPDTLLQGPGLSVGVRYIGKTCANMSNTIENHASFMLDADLHYQLYNWRFVVNATNLLNKEAIDCMPQQ